MTDLRNSRIVVVAHHIVNRATLAASSGAELSAAVIDWAYRSGLGVYQLPVAPAAFDALTPESAAAFERDDSRAAYREVLAFVASQLRVYLDNGYEVAGAVFLEGEDGDPRERIWAEDFLAAAADAGVGIPRVWQLPRTDVDLFDPDDPRLVYPALVYPAPVYPVDDA